MGFGINLSNGAKASKAQVLGMLFAAALVPLSASSVFADAESLADIEIEKTVLALNVPADNKMPWAFVEGKVSNPVADYPVIIQIYDADGSSVGGNNAGAVHFAQIPVNSDGTYEYKFRISNTSVDGIKNIFEGDYVVKIFKVVYTDLSLDSL